MDNQHRKITGYRDLTQDEIDLMNVVKSVGNVLGALIEQMADDPESDKRWVAIAKTDFQTGLMALTRAVAKPESF